MQLLKISEKIRKNQVNTKKKAMIQPYNILKLQLQVKTNPRRESC